MKTLAMVLILMVVMGIIAQAITYSVLSIGFRKSAIKSGEYTQAVVTIDGNAVEGGVIVSFEVDQVGAIVTPGFVVVPEDSNAATFTIIGDPVKVKTEVTLRARIGQSYQDGMLIVSPK